jgi:hypothetical protein
MLRELDNIRAVLSRGLAEGGDLERACRLVGVAGLYWYFGGLAREGLDWSTALVERMRQAPVTDEARVWALLGQGLTAYLRTQMPIAGAAFAEAAPLADALGMGNVSAFILAFWGTSSLYLGDPEAGIRMVTAIERFVALGDRWGEALTRGYLGMAEMSAGLTGQARQSFEAAIAAGDEIGDRWLRGFELNLLAILDFLEADYEAAFRSADVSVADLLAAGDIHSVCWPITIRGAANLHRGSIDWDQLIDGLRQGRETGQADASVFAVAALAHAAALLGEQSLAAELATIDRQIIGAIEPFLWPVGLVISRRELAAAVGEPAGAAPPADRPLEELIALALERARSIAPTG